jgi:WD40 repeat protein
MLVTCGGDNTVRAWTIGGNGAPAAAKTFSGHTDQVFAVAVSPDGKLIASGSYNGEVKIWKADDPKEVKAVKEFNASPGLQQQAAAPQK